MGSIIVITFYQPIGSQKAITMAVIIIFIIMLSAFIIMR